MTNFRAKNFHLGMQPHIAAISVVGIVSWLCGFAWLFQQMPKQLPMICEITIPLLLLTSSVLIECHFLLKLFKRVSPDKKINNIAANLT